MKNFKFIDLFAGIGGFHLALKELGGECVYACEINKDARKTYLANFEVDLFPEDITKKENQELIPLDADILCAGFPCQPFSQIGFKRGFYDTRGNLFFDLKNIIEWKSPKVIFLENVRHLISHDKGKTFNTIIDMLQKDYTVYHKIIKASDYGLPTLRPRLFIVGFRHDIKNKDYFNFPKRVPLRFTMSDVFHGKCTRKIGYTIRVGGRSSGLYDRRNWDSYEVDGETKKISSKEAKMMMGFPDDFKFPVSNSKALKQLGNSIAVNVVKLITKQILITLEKD